MANPTGIWDISGTVLGNPVSEVAVVGGGSYFALATSDEFACAEITGGSYKINGGLFSATGAMLLTNSCPALGSQGSYVPFTLNGYLTGATLNLSFDVQGTLVPVFGATADPLYNEPSSLATLVGNWNDSGNTLTVNADGTFAETQTSGCMMSGAFTILDATHNLYGVSFEITNCTSSMANIPFTGLGYLNDSNPMAWQFIEVVSGPDPSVAGGSMLASLVITPQ